MTDESGKPSATAADPATESPPAEVSALPEAELTRMTDEITLQVVACSECPFEGLAVYEESRRGSLDSESVDHRGYLASPGDVQTIHRLIESCPRPRDPRCRCNAHARLGSRNALGRWDGLEQMRHLGTFRMEL